jgi:hypothetical protein
MEDITAKVILQVAVTVEDMVIAFIMTKMKIVMNTRENTAY